LPSKTRTNDLNMKRQLLALGTLVLTSLFFVSCNKDDNAAGTASLMVVNASPNGSNIDVTVNNEAFVSNLAYPNNSGYKTVVASNANIIVTPTGSTTAILNGTMLLEKNTAYTFYVTDSSHERKASFTKDDKTAPSAGKAKVRLLHLSPNAPNIDVSINGASNANFNNRGFNDFMVNGSYHSFTEVDAAGVTLQVKLAGTSTVIATLPAVTLTAGKIYTFIIKGFVGGAGAQALGLEVITHN
jgi:hypothetical protein